MATEAAVFIVVLVMWIGVCVALGAVLIGLWYCICRGYDYVQYITYIRRMRKLYFRWDTRKPLV